MHILSEPLLVGGIRDKEERMSRIRKSMEDVKLSPVEDFFAQVPAHAQRRAAAAGGDCARHDHAAKTNRGRRTGLHAGCLGSRRNFETPVGVAAIL